MNNNDFSVVLKAILDKSGVNSELDKVQKIIQKYKMNIMPDLNTSAMQNQLKTACSQMAKDINKAFGQNLLSGNDVFKAYTSQMQTVADKAKVVQKAFTDLRKDAYQSIGNKSPELQQMAQYYTALEKETAKASVSMKQFASQNKIDTKIAQLNDQLRKNSKYTKSAKDELHGYIEELKQGNVASSRLQDITTQAKVLHSKMGELNKIGFSWTDKLKNAWMKFGGWTIATGSITAAITALKKGVSFISDIDDALTDVAYTSNITKSQLVDLGNSSIDMAKDLKASATNILEAVKIYSTAKSTAEDILRKSKPAIMLSNVSGMSGAESAKTINTAINQFELKDTSENLNDIVDTLEYVSSKLNYDFTAGIKEITEGIEASGNTAKNAGLNMQEYATMVGLAVEKTGQSGSTIGQAYKTIISRITKASKTEGTLDEDISKAEGALRGIKVEVRDSEKEFKDLSETMHNIGKVWDSLSSVEKSNVGFEVAGTRQINILNSLFGSWDEYESIMADIDDRTGMTLKNQEVYADSLKGHLGDLSVTGQEVWNNLLNSDELKNGIDLLTGLLSVVEQLTSELGGLGTLGAGASAFGIIEFVKNLDWLKCRATNLCLEI